jgi:hypothetical protein
MSAVAEHEVEQKHTRSGIEIPDRLQAQRRVDHRMGSALGHLVCAEVEHGVLIGTVSRSTHQFGPRKGDVRRDRAEQRPSDEHCLIGPWCHRRTGR